MMNGILPRQEHGYGRISVLCLITALTDGGAQMMLYRLMSRLDRTRFTPQIISMMKPGIVGEKILSLGIPVRQLGMEEGKPNPLALTKLVRWLMRDRPSVILTWMYHADLFGGLAARLAGGIPVAWGIHNCNLEGAKRMTLLTVRTCALLSGWLPRRIVCCSESSQRVHAALGYRSERMVVIPNGSDLEGFKRDSRGRKSIREELHIPEDAPVIGLVARFDPQKDHHNFVQAAKLLHKKRPDVRFVLCGHHVNWENKDLTRWIDEAGIRNRVHLLGRRDDIAQLTSAFDIASLSSYGEAFPNVIGEAMSCEVPCVVTDVGDSARIVADTGLVVPPRNPTALAEAWGRMFDLGREQLAQMGLAARQRINDHFNLPQTVDRYHSLLEELAGGSISDSMTTARR